VSWHCIRRAFSIVAAFAIFAGCGGSQQAMRTVPTLVRVTQKRDAPRSTQEPSASPESGRSVKYKTSKPLLFVVNFDSPPYAGVTIYEASQDNPSPIAVITKGLFQPNGACVDGDGTLYVGNDPGSGLGWISEYSLGQTKPVRTITKGINIPAFCAIDAQGNLWVSNAGGVNVTEYLKGSVNPHATITKGLTNPDGIAIDRAGNLYVGNLVPYGASNVQVYPAGSKSPARTITAGVTWPVGIGIDPNGTLYVTNDAQCNVEEYRSGQSEPYREITDEIDGPNSVTFNKDGRLYLVDEGFNGCSGPWPVILEFRRGSVNPSKKIISAGLHSPVGSAYYPPLLP